MKIFNAVIVGLAIFAGLMAIAWIFRASEADDDDTLALPRVEDWTLAVALGVMVGMINYLVPTFVGVLAFWAPISLVAMIIFYIVLMVWWAKEGSNFVEMIPFIALAVVAFFTTSATATMTANMVLESTVLVALITALPLIMLVVSLGFFVASLFYYRYISRGESQQDRIATIVIAVATAIVIIIILATRVWGGNNRVSMSDAGATDVENVEVGVAETTTTADAAAVWYGFYNLNLQQDADPNNDFNFGPDPFREGWTAEDYAKDWRDRMSKDPALAAGDMAWFDAILGTRYLGEFYESCKGDWAKTINLAKERFMADQGLFYQTLNAFFAFVDTADEVTLEYQNSGLEDQMYMNPFTVNNVPDVIVMTTDDHSGYYLTYTFIIKETASKKVPLRTKCGYQPTNVQKVMNIVPDDTPRHDPTPQTNPKPDPTPSGGDGDPTPTPTPTPTPKKDPSKSPKINTEPNDDPGPGTSTNNGAGATTSTADQSTNSNHMTDNQYREEVNDLKEVNQSQKTGSDSNTPSTPAPTPSTRVENNGDNGNGSASINTPTPAPAKDTVSGDPESAGMIGAPD